MAVVDSSLQVVILYASKHHLDNRERVVDIFSCSHFQWLLPVFENKRYKLLILLKSSKENISLPMHCDLSSFENSCNFHNLSATGNNLGFLHKWNIGEILLSLTHILYAHLYKLHMASPNVSNNSKLHWHFIKKFNFLIKQRFIKMIKHYLTNQAFLIDLTSTASWFPALEFELGSPLPAMSR